MSWLRSQLRVRPALLALLACVSGLVLMPAVQLATERLDWRLIVDYSLIFDDGFETGDTSRWTLAVTAGAVVVRLPARSRLAAEIRESLEDGTCFVPALLVPGGTVGALLVEDCELEERGDWLALSFRPPAP